MGFSLDSLFDPTGSFTGSAGDSILSVFDPVGSIAYNEFGFDPLNLHEGTADFLNNTIDFDKSQLSDWFKKFKSNPIQAAVGSMDAGGTKVWNAVLGTDWEPYVNSAGGPTREAYQSAANKGIDTTGPAAMHQIAGTIASAIAGGGLSGAIGGTLGTSAGTSNALAGAAIGAGRAVDNGGSPLRGAVAGAVGNTIAGQDFGGQMGMNPGIAKNMVNTGIGGTASGLASGQSLSQSLKQGGLSALSTGFKQGANNMGTLFGDNFFGDYMKNWFPNSSNYSTSNFSSDEASNMYGPPLEATLPMSNNPAMNASYPSDYIPQNVLQRSVWSGEPVPQASYPAPNSDYAQGINPIVGAPFITNKPTQPQQRKPMSLADLMSNPSMENAGTFAKGHIGDLGQLALSLWQAKRQQNALGGAINGLSGLYNPGGAYAKQLEAMLRAKAAQGGQRSQLSNGILMQKLMSDLAGKAGTLAPDLGRLQGQMAGLQNQQLGAILAAYKNMGGPGLNDLFSKYIPSWGSGGN